MENAKQLLNDVSEKLKRFEASQKESGELFNIFSITKIERREVDTHSAMIAELLNPQGRHGQSDKFLIEFLKIIIPTEFPFAGTKEAKVVKEKSFGKSRVDILIVLDNDVFIIENKIDADDGDKQLQRYKEILDTHYNNKIPHLIYLTIDGSEAEEYSHCGVPYRCISYEEHILNWLDSCIETSNTQPTIKYALKQYQNLIEKITGKSMNHKLNNELVELLLKDNNFETAQKIVSAISLTKGKILFDFFELLKTEIEQLPSVSVKKDCFPHLEYSEEKCRNWFGKKGIKEHHVGIFFDISIPNILFRVEAASQAIYYGIVPVEKDDTGKYELAHNWNELTNNDGLKKENWGKVRWFAIPSKDAPVVLHNIGRIRGENAQSFIDKIRASIESLRKSAGIKVDE